METTHPYMSLIHRLTDPDLLLTRHPEECAGEWSSGDRRSRYDAQTDTYLDWAANDDGTGYIERLPDDSLVIARMEGPGCIWHIWTALAGSGHIHFVIDGAEYAFPFEDCFRGTGDLFPFPGLCYESAGGRNCWVPISYSRSCEVRLSGDWGCYYQIHYTQFQQDAQVEAFQHPLSPHAAAALQNVSDRFIERLDHTRFAPDPQDGQMGQILLKPGENRAIFSDPDSGRLCHLCVKSDHPDFTTLKALTLSIFWDGEASPSVWAPLGDFFGCACGPTPYETLLMGFSHDGWFWCRFPMPYLKGARIVLENDGSEDVSLQFSIRKESYREDSSPLRFHAKWNKDAFSHGRADRWPDKALLKVPGSGVFLGLSLMVSQYYDNLDPKAGDGWYWWGEGDEKIFVDGERYPSLFGTGVEDYFGYAWALTDLFSKAYHAQISNEGGIHDRGDRSFVRFHVADAIPFRDGLEFSLEKYHGDRFVQYGAVAYWYGDSPDGIPAVSLKARSSHCVRNRHPERDGQPLPFTTSLAGWKRVDLPDAFQAGICTLTDNAPSMTDKAQCLPTHPLERIPASNPLPDPFPPPNAAAVSCLSCQTTSETGRTGYFQSPTFVLNHRQVDFLLSGTAHRDPTGLWIELADAVTGEVLTRTGGNGETPRRILWLVEDYLGREAVLRIADEGKGGFHWLRLSDLHG